VLYIQYLCAAKLTWRRHEGSEAAAEFQKIIDHRGIISNQPIGALAHLGLARAYAQQGDTAKAKQTYQNFLELWKDADSDTPILKGLRQNTPSCDDAVCAGKRPAPARGLARPWPPIEREGAVDVAGFCDDENTIPTGPPICGLLRKGASGYKAG